MTVLTPQEKAKLENEIISYNNEELKAFNAYKSAQDIKANKLSQMTPEDIEKLRQYIFGESEFNPMEEVV